MQIWHSSSSSSKPCAKCGKMTSNFKVYEQTNIEVKIPLCDNVYENRYCYNKTDVKEIADIAIKLVKREVKK